MDFCWLFFICLKLNGVKKGASNIVWNELEHPCDEIGRFAFKNGWENFSGRFEKHGNLGVFNDNDLKNAIGGFDVRHPYFDKDGNLHLKIYDTYDFNKNAKDFLNKAGKHEMEAGNLKPYFSIHDIIIPKDEINEILK